MFRAVILLLSVSTLAPYAYAANAKVHRSRFSGVPSEYIVALDQKIPAEAVRGIVLSLAATYEVEVFEVWERSLVGFFCKGNDDAIDAMADDPRIRYIEQNVQFNAPALSSTDWTYHDHDGNGVYEYMWHLDRLDEPSWAQRDGHHNMCTVGTSVTVFHIDRGVWKDHPQFARPGGTRVVQQVDFTWDSTGDATDGDVTPSAADITNGCTAYPYEVSSAWHGTATASLIGGEQLGASKTDLVSLKIARCLSGLIRTRSLINAVDWISNNHGNRRAVINYSGFTPPWDTAFQAFGGTVVNTVNATGIPFITSADNYSADACRFAPNDRGHTRYKNGSLLVVGGTNVYPNDSNDYRWQNFDANNIANIGVDSGSNGGPCVGVYAPAAGIWTARNGVSPTPLYAYGTGTSFSAPLATALAARYIEKQTNATGIKPSPTAVYNYLINQAQGPVYNYSTPEYYTCFGGPGLNDVYYRPGTQPAQCTSGRYGVTGQNSAPFHFPSVNNDSSARVLYWDEANGASCP